MSIHESSCESTITPTQSHTNRIAGSGILLPRRSMPSSIRCMNVWSAASTGAAVSTIPGRPLRGELAEEGRLERDGMLELVEQHPFVGRVDVRVAVGGPDEEDLGARD